MAIRSNPLVQKMMAAGEAQLDRLTTQLLGNEKFVGAVQGIVSRSLSAKGTLDKSIRTVLATMSLPSVQDIDDLRGKLDELDRSVGELARKLDEVEKAMAKPKAAARSTSRAAAPKQSKPKVQSRAKSAAKPAAKGASKRPKGA